MISRIVVGIEVDGRLVDRSVVEVVDGFVVLVKRSVVVEVVDGFVVLVDVEGIVVVIVLIVELVDGMEDGLVKPLSSLVVCDQKYRTVRRGNY